MALAGQHPLFYQLLAPDTLFTACRPHHETLKAYVRKLSALALEVVQLGGTPEQAAAAAGGGKAGGEVSQPAPWASHTAAP